MKEPESWRGSECAAHVAAVASLSSASSGATRFHTQMKHRHKNRWRHTRNSICQNEQQEPLYK